MKTFKIDDFVINIDDYIFNEAVEYGFLDDKNKTINYHCLKNLIRASSCEDLEDLKTFTYEKLRASCSDEEISRRVCDLLKEEIMDYGGGPL